MSQISISDLTGDAFAADGQQLKEYGTKITSETFSYHVLDEFNEILDPQCQNVAFFKTTEGEAKVALQGVSLCYTVKAGQMVRILNMKGEKDLYKGHSGGSLKDLSFSVDVFGALTYTVCSVDDTVTSIWNIEDDEKLTHTQVVTYPIGAQKVKRHPLLPGLFLVADSRDRVGIVSPSISISDETMFDITQQGYTDIRDMCFIPAAKSVSKVLVAVKDCVLYIDLHAHSVISTFPVGSGLFGVECSSSEGASCNIVTFHADSNGSEVSVKVWSFLPEMPKVYPTCDQTVTLSLPISTGSLNSSGVIVKSILGSNNYFAIMSRNSARVALVAIRSPDSPPGYPIYHATYLNMRFPLCTGDLALGTLNGKETLCIACQQDLPGGQAGICKYSMNLSSVVQKPSAVYRDLRPQSSTPQTTGASALLKSMLRPSSPSTTVSSPVTTGVTGSKSALMSMLSSARESGGKDLKSMISSAVPSPPVLTLPPKAAVVIDIHEREVMTVPTEEVSEDSKKAKKAVVVPKKAVNQSAVTSVGDELDEEIAPTLDQRFFKTTMKEQAKAIRSALREDLKAQEAALETLFKEEAGKISTEEIVHSLEKKLHASVATEVKNQLKTALDSSFKKAFEASLLPAFQAGTVKMFGQVQSSFENGMQRLIEHSATVQAGQVREISALKTEIAGLKISMQEILKAIKTSGGVGSGKVAVTRVSELLEAQRYIDAVEFALEKKDLDVLVEVLTYGPLTPARFAEECGSTDSKDRSALLQLCLLQQLSSVLTMDPAALRSVRTEEWLKNTILGLSDSMNDSFYDLAGGKAVVKRTLDEIVTNLNAAKCDEQMRTTLQMIAQMIVFMLRQKD